MKRSDLMELVVEALKSKKLSGKGTPKDVAKYVWDNYESELKKSGDLLYTWQYDIRWAANTLRQKGILKPVHGSTNLPWELS